MWSLSRLEPVARWQSLTIRRSKLKIETEIRFPGLAPPRLAQSNFGLILFEILPLISQRNRAYEKLDIKFRKDFD